MSIASKSGCTPETVRAWVRRTEMDTGRRGGVTSDEWARIKGTRAREPRAAAGQRDSQEPADAMTPFIDPHRVTARLELTQVAEAGQKYTGVDTPGGVRPS